jgi:hypothetical protein
VLIAGSGLYLDTAARVKKFCKDPFNYRAEDELIAAWKSLCEKMPRVAFQKEPGFSAIYSGPGGKPRTSSWP